MTFTEDLKNNFYKKKSEFFSLSKTEKKTAYIKTTAASIAFKMYQRPDGSWYASEIGRGDYRHERNLTLKDLTSPNYTFWYKPDVLIDEVLFPGDWRDQFSNWDETHPDYDQAKIKDCAGNIRIIKSGKGWQPIELYKVL